ncbi:MAG: sodium/proline symporter [Chlamydiota bacterium]
MFLYELSAVILYFILLLAIGVLSYKRHLSAADFIIGNRSLNYWLTALAAHASDMSSWLFMGYPAAIFMGGFINAWVAVGLILFMFLNWQLIAPKIRVATEQYNSLTFSSFFESRLADSSGLIRIFTAVMSLLFYTIYISAALVGLGILLETLFDINYYVGVFLGALVVIPYVFIGGFLTLAWIDLFQGMFLLCAIIFVPLYLMPHIGGWDGVLKTLNGKSIISSLIPNFAPKTIWNIFLIITGWGLGYFGQPHIITKFMGIRNAYEIPKSKWIGMTWMTLALSAATLVGLVGTAYFTQGLHDPEHIFIELVKDHFPPFLVGLILCAILAATINAMSSQVLVVSSSLTEDFYKKIFHKDASSKELLIVSRLGVVFITLLAFLIAYAKISTIYSLILYAWSGLGASFGPLLLLSLYSRKINKYGAWVGILTGGILAAVWPYFNTRFSLEIPTLLPAFTCSFLSILIVSHLTKKKLTDYT